MPEVLVADATATFVTYSLFSAFVLAIIATLLFIVIGDP